MEDGNNPAERRAEKARVPLGQAREFGVERWRFVPARRGATAIESSVLVPLQFNLRN